jgi:hypothetical protein
MSSAVETGDKLVVAPVENIIQARHAPSAIFGRLRNCVTRSRSDHMPVTGTAISASGLTRHIARTPDPV